MNIISDKSAKSVIDSYPSRERHHRFLTSPKLLKLSIGHSALAQQYSLIKQTEILALLFGIMDVSELEPPQQTQRPLS